MSQKEQKHGTMSKRVGKLLRKKTKKNYGVMILRDHTRLSFFGYAYKDRYILELRVILGESKVRTRCVGNGNFRAEFSPQLSYHLCLTKAETSLNSFAQLKNNIVRLLFPKNQRAGVTGY